MELELTLSCEMTLAMADTGLQSFCAHLCAFFGACPSPLPESLEPIAADNSLLGPGFQKAPRHRCLLRGPGASSAMPPRCPGPHPPDPVNATLYSRRDFAGVIKVMDLEMGRLSCIIWLGPKHHHEGLYKKEAEGDLTQKKEAT